jgi:hypothetical protein
VDAPRIEEQIASLEQERAALLAQIQDENAKASKSESRLSLFMLLGGLIGCAGATIGIISAMRKLQMPAATTCCLITARASGAVLK